MVRPPGQNNTPTDVLLYLSHPVGMGDSTPILVLSLQSLDYFVVTAKVRTWLDAVAL